MIYKRNPQAIYIEIAPKVEGTYWTGDIEMNIINNPESTLDKESKESLLHLTELFACSVPLMEMYPDISDRMEKYLALFRKDTKKIKHENNVITVDFKGNREL